MEDDGMIVAMDDKGSLDIRCLEIVFSCTNLFLDESI